LILAICRESGPSMDLDLEGLGLNLRELDLAGELFDYGVGGSKNKDGGSMPA